MKNYTFRLLQKTSLLESWILVQARAFGPLNSVLNLLRLPIVVGLSLYEATGKN